MSEFLGFSPEVIEFYRELSMNNNREWFEDHRPFFDDQIIEPARRLVRALGNRLQGSWPGIVADTRTNGSGSIFRIYRDVRFSKDKTPYKTHLGIFFWQGQKKMESPGFYFHLDADRLMLAVGMRSFSKTQLQRFRKTLTVKKNAGALVNAVSVVTSGGDYSLGGEQLKRIPAGFDVIPEAADFLRLKGMYAFWEAPVPPEVCTPLLGDLCLEKFEQMSPVFQWLSLMDGNRA